MSATATDIRLSARTIPAARLRDHTGAIDGLAETILMTRARRSDGV